jgi:hypothetical protein
VPDFTKHTPVRGRFEHAVALAHRHPTINPGDLKKRRQISERDRNGGVARRLKVLEEALLRPIGGFRHQSPFCWSSAPVVRRLDQFNHCVDNGPLQMPDASH